MIKPPHKAGSSSLKICLQIQASYGEALTKDKKTKIMKKMSSGGDLTPFSGCYNSQLITGRKISFV